MTGVQTCALPICDAGELQVAELQLLCDDWGEDGDGEAVDEVNQGGEENEAGDPPSQSLDSGVGEWLFEVRQSAVYCSIGALLPCSGRSARR